LAGVWAEGDLLVIELGEVEVIEPGEGGFMLEALMQRGEDGLRVGRIGRGRLAGLLRGGLLVG
jgi:hypothetical protein